MFAIAVSAESNDSGGETIVSVPPLCEAGERSAEIHSFVGVAAIATGGVPTSTRRTTVDVAGSRA